METITSFKVRVNKFNIDRGLSAGVPSTIESNCRVCGNYEKGHPDNVDYICSSCVIKLLGLSLAEKKVIYDKADSKNSTKRSETLKRFFEWEDEEHEQRNRKIRRIGRGKRKRRS